MQEWRWGRRSLEIRAEIHSDLVLIVDEALLLSPFDLTLTEGRRGMKAQTWAFENGASELSWPKSKHNRIGPVPSDAVHIDPYPIDYVNTQRYYILAGLIMATSQNWGLNLRWLGLTTLRDLAHWERV